MNQELEERSYALRKKRMLGREANEVRILGKLTKVGHETKRANGDRTLSINVATHSPTYHGFKYEEKIVEHKVLIRDSASIEEVQLAYLYSYVEVIGHLTYSKSPRGVAAEIIASSVAFRPDLDAKNLPKKRASEESYFEDSEPEQESNYDE
jgi:hypothetical protein